jgi:hypothetical protein
MKARLVAAVLLGGLVVAPAAGAQQLGEHLYINFKTMLPGWTLLPTQRGRQVELTEIVPPGQNQQNWTDQVAVNIIYGTPNQSPQDLLAQRVQLIQHECEDSQAGPVAPAVENGYETALRAVACTKAKRWGQGEISLFKAWRGRDASYLVARSWRGPPFAKNDRPVPPETTLQWLAFMQGIVLCDSRDPRRPCPVATANPAAVPAPANPPVANPVAPPPAASSPAGPGYVPSSPPQKP